MNRGLMFLAFLDVVFLPVCHTWPPYESEATGISLCANPQNFPLTNCYALRVGLVKLIFCVRFVEHRLSLFFLDELDEVHPAIAG